MSTSIETKYRPVAWDEVIGQDAVVRSLSNAIAKKLGTAYLLTGPSGTGKTTLARIAATQLGCHAQDLVEVDAATETGIDDVRKITEALMYRPIGGGVKAIIIDEVHGLSKQATTAMLKSLEDPPPWVYWFLCTTEAKKIIKAVQTRCLAYQLKEVGIDDLIDLLAGTDEGKPLSDDILELCAKEAEGSPRQALSNLGVCLTAKSRKEAAELLRSAAEVPAAFELAQALMKGADWADLVGIVGALGDTNPESVRHVVRAYFTKVAIGASGRKAEDALAILEAFSTPFNSSDGITPLLIACGRLSLGGR